MAKALKKTSGRRTAKTFLDFMKGQTIYDLMPVSGKVLVFDTELEVKQAFCGMVSQEVRAALLSSSEEEGFVAMLTLTDFINILHFNYLSDKLREIEKLKLSQWRTHESNRTSLPLVRISPEESLFEAVHVLMKYRIHRLPVIDPVKGNVLYILTHKRLLKRLYLALQELRRPRIMNKSIMDLKIGTFSDLVTVKESDTLFSALSTFLHTRVSALPVVDKRDRVVGLYSRFDVINLAARRAYDKLEVTMSEALRQRTSLIEGVIKCYPKDTLETVIQRIVEEQVHRLVMVDDSDHLLGIVSLSDLLKALVLDPAGIILPPTAPHFR